MLEINGSAIDDPALVNQDPYGDGWMVKIEISDSSELDTLMDSIQYDKFVAGLEAEVEESE